MRQLQLVELLGVAPETVDDDERHAQNPSVDTIARVATALDVEAAYFIDGQAQRRRKPGPPSALEERIERIRRLPKREQDVVLRMLDGLLSAAR